MKQHTPASVLVEVSTSIQARYEKTRKRLLRSLRKRLIRSAHRLKLSYIRLGNLKISTHECISLDEFIGGQAQRHSFARTEPIRLAPVDIRDANSRYKFDLPNSLDITNSYYIGIIEKAVAIGGTELVKLSDGRTVYDEVAKRDRAIYAPKTPDLIFFSQTSNRIALGLPKHPPLKLPIAFNLLKEHSSNYYHWLTECLVRALLITPTRNIPILVDAKLHKNLIDSLRLLLPENPIIEVKKGQCVTVEKLLQPAILSTSHDNYTQTTFANDFVLDPRSLRQLKQRIHDLTPPASKSASDKKQIYLKRVSKVRSLQNASEIESSLTNMGFEAIRPESLSFIEQVQIASSADCIVAPSGAALANIVFCRPRTKVIVLSNTSPSRNHYIFGQIAQALNLDITYVEGISTSQKLHANFVAPVPVVTALVAQLQSS